MSQRRTLEWTLVLLILLLPAAAIAQTTAYAVVPNNGADTVSIIDTRTELVVGLPIAVAPLPRTVVMSPDGRRAYVRHSSEPTLTVIDVAGRKKEAEIALPSSARALAASPDNRWVYLVHSSGTMSVVNVEGMFLTPFTANVGVDPVSIAVTPNGQFAYVGNWRDQTIVVLRLTWPNPSVVTTLSLTMWPVDIEMAPDGLTAFALLKLPFNGAILPIDIATNTFGSPMAVNPGWDLALTYDGALLYAIGTGLSTTAAVLEAATGTGVGSITLNSGSGLAATPNGDFVYVTDSAANSVVIIDRWAQALTGRSIAVGTSPSDMAIGPSVIIQQPGPALPLTIARDSDLTAQHFRAFVPFHGGTLKTTGPWTTTRTLSMMTGGGTIETRSPATLNASTIGPGVLTKTGPSMLTLNAVNRHLRSVVKSGVLSVMSLHLSDVVVDGGTLSGTGTLGHVNAMRGTIAPGSTTGPGVLHASTVTMGGATTTFAVTMVSAAEGGYSRLDATDSVQLGNALLTINPKFTPLPGQTFTIVTNAIGEFANYGEGDVIATPRGTFSISYQGGPLGQDVVLTAW